MIKLAGPRAVRFFCVEKDFPGISPNLEIPIPFDIKDGQTNGESRTSVMKISNSFHLSEGASRIVESWMDANAPSNEKMYRNVHSEDRNRLVSEMNAAGKAYRDYNVEYRVVLADGQIRHMREIGKAEFGETGEFQGHFGTIEDITELRRAEDALRWSEVRSDTAEQRLLDTLESSSEAVVVYDADGCLIICNTMFKKFYGYSDEDATPGTHFGDLGRLDIERGTVLFDLDTPENYIDRRDDSRKNELGGYTVHLASGHYLLTQDHRTATGGVVSTQTDITDRLAAKGELQETEAQLWQAQKMEAVGQLTSGIAHDFNNMLTAIIGNLELLNEPGESNAESRMYLANALKVSFRAAELAHRLLTFSRKHVLQPEVRDLNCLVPDVTELMRRTLGEHIEIETILAAGLWPTTVDKAQFENALLNLAINARGAMPGGGKITIETANGPPDQDDADEHDDDVPSGQYVMVAVTDSGAGMSPEVIKRAFEPFFTTKEEGKGSGLGLSMVSGFVKQSGGYIRISSEIGQGTTVRLHLPRAMG